MFPREVFTLQSTTEGATKLLKRIYLELPMGAEYLRAYKSPSDIDNQLVVKRYREHYPHTKLVVGMRHPVLWFQSMYNFRIAKGFNFELTPDQFDPSCSAKGQHNLCIDRTNYHYLLARFGKTPGTHAELMTSFTSAQRSNLMKDGFLETEHVFDTLPPPPAFVYTPNPIFVYDVEQLADNNATRTTLFRKDVEQYLGLQHDIRRHIPQIVPGKIGQGVSEKKMKERDSKKIDICSREWSKTRKDLVAVGRKVHRWFLDYFIDSPDVRVSNPEFLLQILETYGSDPCDRVEQSV